MGQHESIQKAPAPAAAVNQFQMRPFAAMSEAEVPEQSDLQAKASTPRAGYTLANIQLKDVHAPTYHRQSMPIPNRLSVQAKLSIGQVGDRYEQEADQVAAQVVQRLNAPKLERSPVLQREVEEDEELQMKPVLQREVEEDEELQMKPVLQREVEEDEELQMKAVRSEPIEGGDASAELESAINSARGSGQTMDTDLQAKMGEAMGADFSGVKIHTDSQSDQMNRSIQAKAFTTGKDIFFRQGEYNPGSTGGQELLAHELTHTIQQNAVSSHPSAAQTVQMATELEVRDKIQNVDLTGDILTSDAAIVSEMRDVLSGSGKLIMASDIDALARYMAADKNIAVQQAAEMIASNKGRGFTASNGAIYVLEGQVAAHDIVHETVHVCSAPGGRTKILTDFGEPLNEGFTEYFTKEFCSKLSVADAVAYPAEVAFIQKLAAKVGNAPLHTAYMQNAGMAALIDQIATIWESNAGKGGFKPNKDHAKNITTVTNKLKPFTPENDVWLKFWTTYIFV
jgi:hypothetical protein